MEVGCRFQEEKIGRQGEPKIRRDRQDFWGYGLSGKGSSTGRHGAAPGGVLRADRAGTARPLEDFKQTAARPPPEPMFRACNLAGAGCVHAFFGGGDSPPGLAPRRFIGRGRGALGRRPRIAHTIHPPHRAEAGPQTWAFREAFKTSGWTLAPAPGIRGLGHGKQGWTPTRPERHPVAEGERGWKTLRAPIGTACPPKPGPQAVRRAAHRS